MEIDFAVLYNSYSMHLMARGVSAEYSQRCTPDTTPTTIPLNGFTESPQTSCVPERGTPPRRPNARLIISLIDS